MERGPFFYYFKKKICVHFIIIFENINLGLVGFDETCPVAESLTMFTGDSGPRGPVREVGLTLKQCNIWVMESPASKFHTNGHQGQKHLTQPHQQLAYALTPASPFIPTPGRSG